MTLLTTKSLVVQRGELVLCRGVDIELDRGDICHIIGSNGAGKTTLLMYLAGLLPSTQVKRYGRLVYIGYELGLAQALTVQQNLQFLLGIYGVRATDSTVDEALASVGLSGYQETLVAQLSSGQKRRASLARLWLIPVDVAPLWLLDEPLTALDGVMTMVLQNKLKDLACQGGAVALTSHQPLDIATNSIDLGAYGVDDD